MPQKPAVEHLWLSSRNRSSHETEEIQKKRPEVDLWTSRRCSGRGTKGNVSPVGVPVGNTTTVGLGFFLFYFIFFSDSIDAKAFVSGLQNSGLLAVSTSGAPERKSPVLPQRCGYTRM